MQTTPQKSNFAPSISFLH